MNTFQTYDRFVRDMAYFPKEAGLTYPALGLNGEAGEIAEKVKKIIRDKDGVCSPEDALGLAYELGDILWYVTAMAHALKYDLAEVALLNRTKLESRKERGVLKGNGDTR